MAKMAKVPTSPKMKGSPKGFRTPYMSAVRPSTSGGGRGGGRGKGR